MFNFQSDTFQTRENLGRGSEKECDIETDGRITRSNKEPPGQRCIYIIPGKLYSKISAEQR